MGYSRSADSLDFGLQRNWTVEANNCTGNCGLERWPDGGVWVEFVSVTSTTINANIFSENGQIWERGLFKRREAVT